MSLSTEPSLQVLTTREAADLLGISEQSLRRLVHCGEIKASRVGVFLRIKLTEIERFLEANQVAGTVECRDGRRRGCKPGPKPRTTTN